MKKMKNLFLVGAAALLTGVVLSACGGGNSAAAEAAAIPTDGILGELPKVVAEYETMEAAANAKYEELKASDRAKADKFWKDYIQQGNTTKFKKETLPAVSKTLEGREIPDEVAEGLPLKLEGNFVLDDKREASTSCVFTAEATNQTPVYTYTSVAFDADGNAISTGRTLSFIDYPIAEGKKVHVGFFVSVSDYDAARWAKLAKIVVMDKQSDAFKLAEEQIKANKEAFKNREK